VVGYDGREEGSHALFVGVDERMAMTNVWLEIFQKYAGTRRGDRRKDDASPERDVDDEDKSKV
jgi:hypothetical protein